MSSSEPTIPPTWTHDTPPASDGLDPRWSPRVVPRKYQTDDLPGIGGSIKVRPEDFLVEEIPLYNPSGKGEHLYLMIQKTNLSTFHMLGIVARHFGVKLAAVGYAGLKDKHAITRQVVSVHVPGKTAADFRELRHPKLAVLWADQHENKLRRGHLRGNHFSIRVRDIEPTRVIGAKKVLDRLTMTGVPNRLGEQRFGRCLNNHLIGRAIIRNDAETALRELLLPEADDRPEHARQRELIRAGQFAEAARMIPEAASTERDALLALAQGQPPQRVLDRMALQPKTFFLSSFQSAVFNAVLDDRLVAGTLGTLEPGDLAFKHENGASFEVDGPTAAARETLDRLERLEISPSGPMWGTRMALPGGKAAERERAALEAAGVRPEHLSAFSARTGHEIPGERRPLRVPVRHAECEGGMDEFGAYVKCRFELPPGAFATVVMREVIKPERQAGATVESSATAMGEGLDSAEHR